ncbi:aspartyl-phosphate phosphatase Spo0E family protein [Clostridium saccharoperbutylacetonicum]|uniref:aspartyl-phosphate phosphatase Spo0E family protein n=1 Tax=Clostridium saccharoperbutylacetonicum TaxID=36745 RepID=UPI0039EA12A9
MKNLLGIIIYKFLVKYCEIHKDSCCNCIFKDNSSECMCLVNAPIEWNKPKANLHKVIETYGRSSNEVIISSRNLDIYINMKENV